jgi:hypothetical protein
MEWITGHCSTVLGALAGILAIIAAIVSAKEQDANSAEQTRLLTKLDAKNDDLIKLQQHQLDFYTGKNSRFYLQIIHAADGPRAEYAIQGDNPAREVLATIINVTEMTKYKLEHHSKESGAEANRLYMKSFPIGTVWPDAGQFIREFPFSSEANYLVTFMQLMDKGSIQLVSTKNVNGSPKFAYRVFEIVDQKQRKAKELKKPIRVVDDGFPLDKNGKVEWLDYPEHWMSMIELVAEPTVSQNVNK